MDAIAPANVKFISDKKKSPWRNGMLVRAEKKRILKSWTQVAKTDLQVHYEIYKFRFIIQISDFVFDIITRNNNARVLFATVNKLTNPPVSVASELFSTRACNEFASFFTDIIEKIRQAVSASVANSVYMHPTKTNPNTMTQFDQINHKNLEDIIQHLKSSSCCLDILPTGFLKKASNVMTLDLMQIVNTSLISGIFPQALKTAVIKPLLKKINLDKSVLSNCRPISNLPFLVKIIE